MAYEMRIIDWSSDVCSSDLKLAGGGYFKIINQVVPQALKKLGYGDNALEEIVRYAVGNGTLVGAPGINHATLKAQGFTSEALDKLEQALASAFDIKFAFKKWTLCEEFCDRMSTRRTPDTNAQIVCRLLLETQN